MNKIQLSIFTQTMFTIFTSNYKCNKTYYKEKKQTRTKTKGKRSEITERLHMKQSHFSQSYEKHISLSRVKT